MFRIFSILVTALCIAHSAFAQSGTDIWLRDDLSLLGYRQKCQLLASKQPPYSFIFREVQSTTTTPTLQNTSRILINTPVGGVVTIDEQIGGSYLSPNYSDRFDMSSDGRNIAFSDRSNQAVGPGVWFSSDYGNTFARLPFLTVPGYPSQFGSTPYARFPNFKFGPDNKLYVFYYSINPNNVGFFDVTYLHMLVVDQTGAVTHMPIGPTAGGFSPLSISVTTTNSHIVAAVFPGRAFTPRGGTAVERHHGMFVVYDFVTQTYETVDYGIFGTGTASLRDQYIHVGDNNRSSNQYLTSDGTNLYMINGLPKVGTNWNFAVREYSPGLPGNAATYFPNTEKLQPGYSPTWEPYMDLAHPSLTSTGVTLQSLGALGGKLYGIVAPWSPTGPGAHSVDIVYHTQSQIVPAVFSENTRQRIRVSNPNLGIGAAVPERIEDFSAGDLSQNFSIYSEIRTEQGSLGAFPLENSVLHSFCQYFEIPWLNNLYISIFMAEVS